MYYYSRLLHNEPLNHHPPVLFLILLFWVSFGHSFHTVVIRGGHVYGASGRSNHGINCSNPTVRKDCNSVPGGSPLSWELPALCWYHSLQVPVDRTYPCPRDLNGLSRRRMPTMRWRNWPLSRRALPRAWRDPDLLNRRRWTRHPYRMRMARSMISTILKTSVWTSIIRFMPTVWMTAASSVQTLPSTATSWTGPPPTARPSSWTSGNSQTGERDRHTQNYVVP
jgi:hypothetical protein